MHFRPRDKDGGHIIRSAIAETPRYTQTSWLYVLQNPSYYRSRFYIAVRGFSSFFCSCNFDLEPMTFIYDNTNLAVFSGDIPDVQIMNFLRQSFRKYRQTDRHDRIYIYHAASRVV